MKMKFVTEVMNSTPKFIMDKFELFMCCRGNGTTISNKAVLEHGDYKNVAHIADCGRLTWYANPEKLPNEVRERITQYATGRHAEWEKWLEKKSEFNQYCILFEELTIKQQNAIVLDQSKESVLQKIDRMKTIIGNDLERNMFATTATPDQKERR